MTRHATAPYSGGAAAAGLVERVRHPDDGRVIVVAATERGLRAFAESRAARSRLYGAVTDARPEKDRTSPACLTRPNRDLEVLGRAQ